MNNAEESSNTWELMAAVGFVNVPGKAPRFRLIQSGRVSHFLTANNRLVAILQ